MISDHVSLVFTELSSRPIQFSIRNVQIYVFQIMFVPSVNNRNHESWRLLVKEHIANIGELRTPLC